MQSEANLYHIVARGTGRQLIFEDDYDRRGFLGLLKEQLEVNGVELYAWCLMANHVHLLMRAPLPAISATMRRVLSTYAKRFNLKTGRVGHLFQSRFDSEPITDDAYLVTVIRYIHNNPVKAGLSSVGAYPWSSYGEYVGVPWICNTEFPLAVFGGVAAFKKFHEQENDDSKCLDMDFERNATRAMPDSRALELARSVLGEVDLQELKALPKAERNGHLRALKEVGLTVRQIERLTGIGRNIVGRAK